MPDWKSILPFDGMRVTVVEAGTTFPDEQSGEDIIVDDQTSVSNGAEIYCTQKTFDALKARCATEAPTAPETPGAITEAKDHGEGL